MGFFLPSFNLYYSLPFSVTVIENFIYTVYIIEDAFT